MKSNFDYDVEGLLAKDKAHSMHPWHEFGRADHTLLADSEGIYVYDGEGNKYIDGIGGMWAVQLGYGNEEMAQAIADQVRKMVYYSPWSMATPPHAEVSAKLATLTPGDLNRFFYSTGGSTANDAAVRFAHYYWNVMERRTKKMIISRADAYHGSTYLADSLSGKPGNDNRMERVTEWITHVSSPNPYRKPDESMTDEEYKDHLIKELEDRILEIGAENCAAFIAEPVLASGGVIVPPKGYQKACLDVCHKHEILYISDEVVTGFGRMGHFFASEEVFDVVPDILTAAKGFTSGYIPAGLTAISERLHQDIIDKSGESATFSMGFTYSGHPVAMAAALKNIEIMERDGLMEHAQVTGEYFQERLNSLADMPMVGDTRGVGMMGCLECVQSKTTKEAFDENLSVGKKIDQKCQENGLILRPMWSQCVFSPPIIITKAQVDDMFDIMATAVKEVADELVRDGSWNGKD
ncbi:MAG: aminotransferase [Rhodospirillaceae bacterium]|jgi:putrescine---pyruvate transaminase|nr:aminotransferase [Rhodospirillaceae bacterium]MBT7615589.1 aminotransferase [Rhodospirillaceae bacterium]MBT7648594.1 aminotransferase [Rhodospirillaceae bacterium]